MAEFQSIFTGQEVDNTINKLRSWIAVDGTYPTVTISGVTYAVIWKSIPVSGKACYGIGLHPTTGRVYEIYYNGSSYTATALDADTKNTAGAIDNNTDKLYLVGAKNQGESPQTYSNSKVYTQNGKLYSNNTEVSVVGHAHSFDTITNRGEAFLSWGGKNFSGSYGPIDAAMVPELGANRLAFMPANAVTIEYSRDGGSTWTDYGPTDSQKINLFNGLGSSFTIGKATSGAGNIATNKYQLRVNIYTSAGQVYTALNKFVIYLSTSGTNNNWCTIRARKQSDYTAGNDTWTTFADKISVSGWSGYNVINTSGITTYGNTASTQYGHIQFIFGCDTGSTNNSYPGLTINKIFGFGGVGWTAPSTMAKTGHMYTYDSSQNVTFPAGVSAKSFTEGGKSLANKYLGKTAKAADADKLDGNDSTYYLDYNNLTNKPTLGTAASKNTGTSSGNVPILDSNGKLADSVIPAVAITDTYVVATEDAMLALSAQKGDIAIRSDLNKSFVLQTTPASTLANWKELLTPTDAVLSVNGKTGAVTLNLDDIGDGSTRKLANYVPKSLTSTKGDMIYASAANTPARLGIGSNGQFLSIDSGIPKWVNNPNTDTKVTSVDNHYSPTANSGAELTAALSGTAGAYAKDTEYTVLTGVKAQRDAKGHVTGITYTAQKIKDTNTDTNTSHSHSAGVGLVGSGSAGTGGGTYDYKAKLRSETALTVDSAAATTTSGRVYPVAVDKSGYLSVNVPWTDTNTDTDTHYTNYLQIKGNGTEAIKFEQNANKTLNLKPGTNVSISATSGEITIGATVPTKLSELENDEGYVDNTAFNSHTGNTSNPHNVTKAQVGLGNVDNTKDIDKPISTLQQKGLDKSLYNLGAFDTISGAVITRKTGYINKNNITSYVINGDYPSSTAYITGDFLTRINNVNNIKSNKNIYLNNLTTDNISLNKIDGAFNSQEALDQFISELEIQYETKTSYTDGKIENQPLITLDSLGSQWLRDEWEKGINLYSGEKTFSGNDTRRFFAPKLQLYNNGTFLQEFHSTDVRDINTLVSFTFTKPSNCNVLKFGHNGSQIDVTTSYDISNLSNKTYTLSFLVTSYTEPQSFTNIMLNEGTHALPYQEYNGSIIREKQFNDLLDWIKTNVVAEKTQPVRGNANGYSGGSYYYYEGSFKVDGIVKTAVFTNTTADTSNISHSGSIITYKLYSKTAGKLVSGTIKYTFVIN